MMPGGFPVFKSTEQEVRFADLAMAAILRREVMWWVFIRARKGEGIGVMRGWEGRSVGGRVGG